MLALPCNKRISVIAVHGHMPRMCTHGAHLLRSQHAPEPCCPDQPWQPCQLPAWHWRPLPGACAKLPQPLQLHQQTHAPQAVFAACYCNAQLQAPGVLLW